MTKQVTLTIDGRQVTVPEGMGLAEAAKLAGIDIPVFCHHPKLEPVGMCRMCLVEIGRPLRDRATGQFIMENGAPKIQFMPKVDTACTTKVEEGMVVLSQSAKATDGQKGTVEFLLTPHPLDCPICDKGGECPLQNLTMAHGPGKSRFIYDEKIGLCYRCPFGTRECDQNMDRTIREASKTMINESASHGVRIQSQRDAPITAQGKAMRAQRASPRPWVQAPREFRSHNVAALNGMSARTGIFPVISVQNRPTRSHGKAERSPAQAQPRAHGLRAAREGLSDGTADRDRGRPERTGSPVSP